VGAVSELVEARRSRVEGLMAELGLDVLVLGRQDDATYATGARRLWTASTRPVGAGCVLVASTGQAHVLTSWEEGLPASIPFEDAFPLTWNPVNLAASLAAIEGLPTAGRIGVDALSPGLVRLLGGVAAGAELVPVDRELAALRAVKLPDEVAAIGGACAIASRVAHEVMGSSGPDLEREGAALVLLGRLGVTTPSSGVRVDGEVVDIGILVDGYEGGFGGRFVDGRRVPAPALGAACRAGADWSDLAAAAAALDWEVRGLGMGYERPVLGPGLGKHEVLDEAMVLSVRDGDHRDVVHVTADGPVVLSPG
jgi:Xaa-Pro aminopeptidase